MKILYIMHKIWYIMPACLARPPGPGLPHLSLCLSHSLSLSLSLYIYIYIYNLVIKHIHECGWKTGYANVAAAFVNKKYKCHIPPTKNITPSFPQ